MTAPRMSAERLARIREAHAGCEAVARAWIQDAIDHRGASSASYPPCSGCDLLAEIDALLEERDEARRHVGGMRREAGWAEPTEKKFWPLPWE